MKVINKNLYADIKGIVEQARNNAVRAVNFTMVIAYWQIGRRIVEEEQGGKKKAEYGQYLLKALSEKLIVDFGKGFDERELRKMRQFFLLFSIRDAVSPESKKNSKLSNRDAAGPLSSTKIKSTKRHAVRDESGSVSKRDAVSHELMENKNDLMLQALRPELSWTHELLKNWKMNCIKLHKHFNCQNYDFNDSMNTMIFFNHSPSNNQTNHSARQNILNFD